MEYARCSLCGQDDTELLFAAPDNAYAPDLMTNIVQCRHCGFAYANPRVEASEIGSHYPADDYYSYQEKPDKPSLKDYLKTAARRSVPGYDKGLSGIDRLVSKTVGRVLLRQMDIIVPFRENARILDIGCGNGSMIGWMKDFGWETYGVEISEKACEVARRHGLQAFCGQVEDAGFEDKFFDVITMSHVIEHIYDPAASLKECRRVLKDDGLLIVDCPNFGCYDSRLFGPRWHQVDVPRHVNHFTKKTLERLLTTSGFEVQRWRFKPPIPLRDSLSVAYYKRGRQLGAAGRMSLEARATVLKALGYVFSINRGEKYSWNLTAYAAKAL